MMERIDGANCMVSTKLLMVSGGTPVAAAVVLFRDLGVDGPAHGANAGLEGQAHHELL
jgi:hypothetical protein